MCPQFPVTLYNHGGFLTIAKQGAYNRLHEPGPFDIGDARGREDRRIPRENARLRPGTDTAEQPVRSRLAEHRTRAADARAARREHNPVPPRARGPPPRVGLLPRAPAR